MGRDRHGTGANMGRARILVIDDERAVRELISDALKIEGHGGHTAENGKEALDLIGRNPFDLVFCDLRMPEMDGQQLYEEIQRDQPQILKRICFVTAQANSSDYGPFLRTTGIPVIEKPFTLSQLRQIVGKMGGGLRAPPSPFRKSLLLAVTFGRPSQP